MTADKHTSTTAIADALRTLADRLDATPIRELPPMWLQVSLQAVRATYDADAGRRVVYPLADRRDAVDALAAHLDLGAPAGDRGSTYGAAQSQRGVYVNVYTGNEEDQP